jgi:hypothetical protein
MNLQSMNVRLAFSWYTAPPAIEPLAMMSPGLPSLAGAGYGSLRSAPGPLWPGAPAALLIATLLENTQRSNTASLSPVQ